ncbi:hypothetical protein N0V85_008561 [Neurospora sp. IMI 360204]|nr:hypothetical protein N0V85_008561 [Neurospora sp. IMI 360204]
MGGSLKLRKVFGLKPKPSSANLQPQPITPDNFNSDDLNANGIYSNNGGYHSYTPNGSSAFSSNNFGQAPGLSSISELPANEYGNGLDPVHRIHNTLMIQTPTTSIMIEAAAICLLKMLLSTKMAAVIATVAVPAWVPD